MNLCVVNSGLVMIGRRHVNWLIFFAGDILHSVTEEDVPGYLSMRFFDEKYAALRVVFGTPFRNRFDAETTKVKRERKRWIKRRFSIWGL